MANEWRVGTFRVYKRIFFAVCRQRPYHVENTGSRPITEVKQRRARLVLGWVTAWEHRVLLAIFFLFPTFFSLFFSLSLSLSPLFFSFFCRHIQSLKTFIFRQKCWQPCFLPPTPWRQLSCLYIPFVFFSHAGYFLLFQFLFLL